jgi:hypothetical protein
LSHTEIATNEPAELTAGDTWNWDQALADHLPSDGWELEYRITLHTPSGHIGFTIGTTPAGDHFEVRKPAADTAAFPPGNYAIVGYVKKAPDRFIIYDGYLFVKPNPESSADPRLYADKMVAALQTELLARTEAGSVTSWTRGGRSETLTPLGDLQRLLSLWQDKVREYRTGQWSTPVEVTFCAPH